MWKSACVGVYQLLNSHPYSTHFLTDKGEIWYNRSMRNSIDKFRVAWKSVSKNPALLYSVNKNSLLLFSTFFSLILKKKNDTGEAHSTFNDCKFRKNWRSLSHTWFRGVNKFLSRFFTVVPFWWKSYERSEHITFEHWWVSLQSARKTMGVNV